MSSSVLRARARLSGIKGMPEDRRRFYQIYFGEQPSSGASAFHGPYRDKTDAENAAEDEAKRRGIELDWEN